MIYCPVRKIEVEDQPEERVRQKLVKTMVQSLGYPLSGISIEKSLRQMPHISGPVPDCRVDILVYAPGIHPDYPLYPLLIIECKAQAIKEDAFQQVIGYNHYCGAPYFALAGADEFKMGWWEENSLKTIPFLPSYQQLLASR